MSHARPPSYGMPYRKIHPSSGESNASTSQPGLPRSESVGSNSHHLRDGREAEESPISSVKRRRVPHSVTKNACLNCKKARAKCDGNEPCKRCTSRVETFACVYEIHIKNAKEELIKQIKELKAKNHLTEQILHALSTGEKSLEILDQLKNGHAYTDIVEWLAQFSMDIPSVPSPWEPQYSAFEASDHEIGPNGQARVSWTTVISDHAVLDHLLQLYFVWVHPVHTLFNKDHFLDSYRHHSEEYCSSILVNALCAMACHLHLATDEDEIDFDQLGLEFSDAVRADIDAEDKPVTTIQAFAVMFLVGCSRANALRATSYLKIASAMLADIEYSSVEGFQEVWRDTVSGVRNLNVEWAQIICQVAPAINIPPPNGNQDFDEKLDSAVWHIYPGNDLSSGRPGLMATTNVERSKLVTIIEGAVAMMYSQHGPHVTAQQVLQQYDKFVEWRHELSQRLRGIASNDSQALPHVLSLLILYSNSVVQLLRPLLDLEGFPTDLLEDTIWNHAQQGLFFLGEHSRFQYTYRYQSPLQMFAVLHLTDVVARFFPRAGGGYSKTSDTATHFGLDILSESQARFPIAGPLYELLRRTANECGIPLSQNADEPSAPHRLAVDIYRVDDFINACTRHTYVQPVKEVHTRYSPSFAADWASYAPAFDFRPTAPGSTRMHIPSTEERGARSLMQIRNLLNTN